MTAMMKFMKIMNRMKTWNKNIIKVKYTISVEYS